MYTHQRDNNCRFFCSVPEIKGLVWFPRVNLKQHKSHDAQNIRTTMREDKKKIVEKE